MALKTAVEALQNVLLYCGNVLPRNDLDDDSLHGWEAEPCSPRSLVDKDLQTTSISLLTCFVILAVSNGQYTSIPGRINLFSKYILQ